MMMMMILSVECLESDLLVLSGELRSNVLFTERLRSFVRNKPVFKMLNAAQAFERSIHHYGQPVTQGLTFFHTKKNQIISSSEYFFYNNDNLNTPGVVITWTKGQTNTNLRSTIFHDYAMICKKKVHKRRLKKTCAR